jgi:DNA invertase Pin-like site-specific DNA recombinase
MTKPTATGHAIAYVRVSTDAQADSGLGLDAQRGATEQAATRLGLTITATYTDAGLSGSKGIEDRPGLLDAVNALKRGDVLLVAKRDRVGRDVVAVALIERLIARKGAKVLSAAGEGTDSDDPTGLLMRRIVDAFGEYERLIIGARTKAALRSKRAQGLRAGNVPYGFTADAEGRLHPHSDEQRTLAAIESHRASGLSLRAVAGELNRAGLHTRSGAAWRHEYVVKALRSAATTAAAVIRPNSGITAASIY